MEDKFNNGPSPELSKYMMDKTSELVSQAKRLQGEPVQALQESNATRLENLLGKEDVPVQRIQDMSRNQLIRLAQEQQNQLNKADLAGMIAQAKAARPNFGHREAFMLMRYVSEGGTDVKLIWNSRDGVTPFQIHIDKLKYTHDIPAMQGPFFDRPEGCIAQWETRTEMEMMLACRRMLNKGMLLGQLTEEQVMKYQNDPDFARSWNMHIGLRSMATGRYTDDPGVA